MPDQQFPHGGDRTEDAAGALLTACRLLALEHHEMRTRAADARPKGQTTAVRRMRPVLEEAENHLAEAAAVLSALEDLRQPSGRAAVLGAAAGSVELAIRLLAGVYTPARPPAPPAAAQTALNMLGATAVLRTVVQGLATELETHGARSRAQRLSAVTASLDTLRARFAGAPPGASGTGGARLIPSPTRGHRS